MIAQLLLVTAGRTPRRSRAPGPPRRQPCGVGLAAVPEHGRGEDGKPEEDGRPDTGHGVQPGSERRAGAVEQVGTELTGQLLGRAHGRRDALAGDVGGLGGHGRGKSVGQLAAVDEGGKAAQRGDAHRDAELAAGLDDRRSRAGPLGGADPMTRLPISGSGRATPPEARISPVTDRCSPPVLPTCVISRSPPPATANPAATMYAGRIRRARAGASSTPPIMAMCCRPRCRCSRAEEPGRAC